MKAVSLLTVILSLFLFGTTSNAATSAATSRSSASVGSAGSTAIDISGGLMTSQNQYGGTFLAGVSTPVERYSPVRLGLDTGVMFLNGGVGLPALVSVIYNFEGKTARPYIGGSVGPIIGLSSQKSTVGGVTVSSSTGFGTDVQLGILVRPGLRFNVSELVDVTIEIPFGGITGNFYIAPTVGVALKV